MQVRDLMSEEDCITSPSDTIQQAATLMLGLDVGMLPVAENDRLIGMISDRDIAVRAVAHGRDFTTPVRDVMTEDVRYCFEHQDADDVARNMASIQVRRLPVVNDQKRLVGILSLSDIANFADEDRSLAPTLRGISRPGGEHHQ